MENLNEVVENSEIAVENLQSNRWGDLFLEKLNQMADLVPKKIDILMDYKTARNFLIDQGTALETQKNPDAFLNRLQQGQPPIPGQLTSLLLALKIVFDALKEEPTFDRQLASALYQLAMASHQNFDAGRQRGVEWPPLLQEDLKRVALAVKSIFAGQWYS